MVFSGIPFLYYFLPCVLLAYFVMPEKARNIVLLISSLLFYAWGEPVYVLLMLFTILIGFLAGIGMEKSMEHSWHFFTPRRILTGSVFVFLGIFIYFKYMDFFISNLNSWFGVGIPLLRVVLPIGISFYTFQIISYLVDVYRGEVCAQKNIVLLATYIAMFPQLIAGPIVRYSSIEQQLKKRNITWIMAERGISRFVIGLSKKVLIANELGELCDIFRASADKSVIFYWMYAVAFMLHIYFDFSGYSDMAIGLGKLLGFVFPENFNYPYIAGSITEFWRRWHITLGSWFRDYVYIPLGGNRVSKIKWYRNIFLVWMFTGFWHGASWNFIVWGLYFGVLLIIEKNWLMPYLENSKWLRHIYVLLLVMFSFVIFNATDITQAVRDVGGMFGGGGLPLFSKETGYYLRSYGITILVAVIGCTPLARTCVAKIKIVGNEWLHGIAGFMILVVLWVLSTAYLVDGSFNPFLYFRF